MQGGTWEDCVPNAAFYSNEMAHWSLKSNLCNTQSWCRDHSSQEKCLNIDYLVWNMYCFSKWNVQNVDTYLIIGNQFVHRPLFWSMVLDVIRGVVTAGSRGAAAPPDFWNPKKLSHKNAIKSEFSKKWGKIGLLAPPDFRSSRRPCIWITMFKALCQQLHLDFVCGNKASEQAKCLIAQIDDANNYLLIITGSWI